MSICHEEVEMSEDFKKEIEERARLRKYLKENVGDKIIDLITYACYDFYHQKEKNN